jgi:hypothetical protein
MKFEGSEQSYQEKLLETLTTTDKVVFIDLEKNNIDRIGSIAEQLHNPAIQIDHVEGLSSVEGEETQTPRLRDIPDFPPSGNTGIVTEGLEKYVREHPEIFRPQHVEAFSRDEEGQQTTSPYEMYIISDGTLPLPAADVAEQQELPREEQ